MTLTVMPKYEAYKDSGVEWLGDVPEHWDVIRLKNAALINPVSDTTELHLDDEICFLPMEKVGADGTVEYDQRRAYRSVKQGFTSFKNNDVIIAKITPCFENGKGAHLKSMPTTFGYGSTEFHVLRANERFNPAFLYYLSKSHSFMDLGEKLMTGSAGQKRVPTDFITEFRFASPSFVEQTAIANFLDTKTTQIDEAIAIKEQQIALLNERKQILIQQAVTQGLDPTVPMKDSGVKWIGKIPEHWGIRRGKFLFKKMSRPVRKEDDVVTCFRDGEVTLRTNRRTDGFTFALKEHGYQGVRVGDLVIHAMDAFAGAIGISDSDGKSTPVYSVCTPVDEAEIFPTYYAYYLRNLALTGFIESLAKGIRERSTDFRFNDFSELFFPLPPKSIQQGIVSYINSEFKKIDFGISHLLRHIEKLKEYKTTLINSAVTGKIKVV